MENTGLSNIHITKQNSCKFTEDAFVNGFLPLKFYFAKPSVVFLLPLFTQLLTLSRILQKASGLMVLQPKDSTQYKLSSVQSWFYLSTSPSLTSLSPGKRWERGGEEKSVKRNTSRQYPSYSRKEYNFPPLTCSLKRGELFQ